MKYLNSHVRDTHVDMVNLKWSDAEECLRCTTTVNIHYFCIFIKLSLQEFLIPLLRGPTHWNVRKSLFYEPQKYKFVFQTYDRKYFPFSSVSRKYIFVGTFIGEQYKFHDALAFFKVNHCLKVHNVR